MERKKKIRQKDTRVRAGMHEMMYGLVQMKTDKWWTDMRTDGPIAENMQAYGIIHAYI